MSRDDRQRRELLRLCQAGAVSRAVDLAFQHFADFGPDGEVLARLADAIGAAGVPPAVHRRFDELRAAFIGGACD